MKKIFLVLAMLCTANVSMAEDPAPPPAPVCPAPAPAPKPKKHGFFHPLVRFFVHGHKAKVAKPATPAK